MNMKRITTMKTIISVTPRSSGCDGDCLPRHHARLAQAGHEAISASAKYRTSTNK